MSAELIVHRRKQKPDDPLPKHGIPHRARERNDHIKLDTRENIVTELSDVPLGISCYRARDHGRGDRSRNSDRHTRERPVIRAINTSQ